ncbi:hypothetical protein HDU91_002346 [Kappamyces sp. JEL0680]|nr:hypothetical protein HDU91_002346 [Kappamyces sp. JEL0680]
MRLEANPCPSPYWIPAPIENPTKFSARKNWDIVVIGSGISGASLAWHLACLNPHLDVLVLEARGISEGATGRNGGLLWASFPPLTLLEMQFGTAEAARMVQFQIDNVAAIQSFVLDHVEPGARYDPCLDDFAGGGIDLIDSAELMKMWERDIPRMNALGLEVSAVSVVELNLVFEKEYVGAIRYAKTARIRPAYLCYHLLDQAAKKFKRDFTLLTHTLVEKVVPTNGRLSVVTSQGTFSAGKVAFCTNGYIQDLMPALDSVTPVRNQVIATKPVVSFPASAISANQGYEYMSMREDGRVVLGGMRYLAPHMDFDQSNDASVDPAVSSALNDYLSINFSNYQVDYETELEWPGIMGFTPNNQPIVGEIQKNQFVSVGFSGHGMPRAHLCAKALAKHMLGLKIDPGCPRTFLHFLPGSSLETDPVHPESKVQPSYWKLGYRMESVLLFIVTFVLLMHVGNKS